MRKRMKNNKNQHRTKPESDSTAQITNLCDTGDDPEKESKRISVMYEQCKRHSKFLLAFFALQVEGGLRVSEVLAVQWSDIDSLGRVTVRTLKKGVERVVSSGIGKEYLLRCRKAKTNPFDFVSRFYIYREYNKIGIVFKSATSTKNSVTHAPRHISALVSRKVNRQEKTIANSLGQKSLNSTKQYGKEATTKKHKHTN
jgi:integrase